MPEEFPYHAIQLPKDVLETEGTEILRAGLIGDELTVSAHRAFKDPAEWGEALAKIVQHLAVLYSAEDDGPTEQEALAEIESAFAAGLGARRATKPSAPRKR